MTDKCVTKQGIRMQYVSQNKGDCVIKGLCIGTYLCRVTTARKQEVERLRTNIGHIRVKTSGTSFPDKAESKSVPLKADLVLLDSGLRQKCEACPWV